MLEKSKKVKIPKLSEADIKQIGDLLLNPQDLINLLPEEELA